MAISPVITGYYRYTDIWFEWHQALPNPDDRGPLKAVLAHDALVHPDHPLRRKDVDGTLQNYETRLLFSSAQVEYLRYWLHAMGLTKEPISIPYSDCLLTDSNLRHVSPVVYKTGGELKSALKKIEKNNKRLKGANPLLNTRRDLFERVRSYWASKRGVWCALDFEAWDRDHTLLTEFGWSLIRWQDDEEIEEQGHLIVKEHRYYTNTYVPNHGEHFKFGESQIVTRADFKQRIQDLISSLSENGPVYLVFHDNNQDIKYLRSKMVDAQLPELTFLLPDATPSEGMFIIDTSDLFAALEGESGHNRRSLERVCRHLQIPTEYLHNAGNDAHHTLQALTAMASGDPLDIQREKRWPNRTDTANSINGSHVGAGVKVQFQAWEDEDDFSDQEGLFASYSGYNLKTGELRTPPTNTNDNDDTKTTENAAAKISS
ncbi:hypothetical protein SERLA73DRAFT_150940 [Serpula lacrymans var. lacrymans S7.3]|uniref:Gfd2/YDR514C-like C-terminal domain-containing protein n=1 Tax=Serpula lacrymans var. lacrymans (strain S7.3) TaxID=936435 RepID=F8PNZ7_SERL3|nr:hypothetical protein SERLA73DRAFT_150940 [Serpula lacrymans var. lacrymans S7.3]